MIVELTGRQQEILMALLEERLGTQREQIYHSDTFHFKDALKAEEAEIRTLMDKLAGISKTPIERERAAG